MMGRDLFNTPAVGEWYTSSVNPSVTSPKDVLAFREFPVGDNCSRALCMLFQFISSNVGTLDAL